MEEKLPLYDSISNSLLENKVFIEAGEAHGLLCGLLICNPKIDAATWLMIATDNDEIWKSIPDYTKTELEALCELTLKQLRDPDFHFEILLPPDTELLAERVRALGNWCKGFVRGVEHYGNYLGELIGRAQDEVDEALSDIQAISEVDYKVKEYEEQEKSFSAVVEYVRIAVLLVQRELSASFNQSSGGTLH